MAETLAERSCFVLQGIYNEIFRKQLPERMPTYPAAIDLLIKLRQSQELELKKVDRFLIIHLDKLISYGAKWEDIFPVLSGQKETTQMNRIDYKDRISEIIRLLEQKIKKPEVGKSYLSLSLKLEWGLQFFKVNIPGYTNNIPEPALPLNVPSVASPPFKIKTNEGNPLTYLHNPLREDIIFAKKERLKGERFSDYLVPFMKRHKLGLYLCSVETMLGRLAQKYNRNGVLNIVAVSKEKFVKDAAHLDDRTLFIVLENDGQGYIPLELCYGGILRRVPLLGMQTLAFVAGLRPDEISVVSVNEEFESAQEGPPYAFDPSRIALVGWWHDALKRSIQLYFGQNLRLALVEFIFQLNDFLAGKTMPKGKTIFEAAVENGFSFDEAGISPAILETGKPEPFSLDLRTGFYDFLQTPAGEGLVEQSRDYLIDLLINVAALTLFDSDPEENKRLQENEIESLRKQTRTEKQTTMVDDAIHRLRQNLYQKIRMLPRSRRDLFSGQQYDLLKKHLRNIEKTIAADIKFIDGEIDRVLVNEFFIDVGNMHAYVFSPAPGEPVEIQARNLIKKGFRTFIFYGTAGAVTDVPLESLVIPEVIYLHPAKYVIDPMAYEPVPVENLLLTDSNAMKHFNTGSFYKTHHVIVSSQFQEHAGFLQLMRSFFGQRRVTVEMDIAPLAELCVQEGAGLGVVFYVTDVLAGTEARAWSKGYHMRQLILSLFRSYEGQKLLFGGQPIEHFFNGLFRTILETTLRRLLA